MNRIISMILRQVVNRLLRVGIDKGVDVMARRRRGTGAVPMTPEEDAARQRSSKDMSRRARQALRLGRRFGRF